jgi:hypothetical protein
MIKYCWETGVIECIAPIEEVKQFIENEMGKKDFIHCAGQKSVKIENKPARESAKTLNYHISQMRGVKNYAQFEQAIDERTINPWYVYNQRNEKVFVNPFKKENK